MSPRRGPAPIRWATTLTSAALLLTGLPGHALAAGSAPVITPDADNVIVDEDHLALLGGDWFDADGDDVSFAATLGSVDEFGPGRWRWSFPTADGPFDATVTISATDTTGASSSIDFELHVNNVPPEGWTQGPAFVPVGSLSSRAFLWTIKDVDADNPEIDVTCGTGTVVGASPSSVVGRFWVYCHFPVAGPTLVGAQATDKDGAYTDARIPVTATTAVKSMTDGRIVIDGDDGGLYRANALAAVDLDADGRADIAIGSAVQQHEVASDPGLVMVIRGRSDAVALDLDDLPGGASWTISGPPDIRFGSILGAAGDMNGDGRGDVVVGSLTDAWVVFGRPGFTDIDVRTMEPGHGFRITGHLGFEAGPQTMVGVGDVNGDGFDDLAVGSPSANDGEGELAVLLGAANLTDVDVGTIAPARGFTIRSVGRDTGWSVAGGDINDDGLADVAVVSQGGPYSNALVVFGVSAPVDVDQATMTSAQGFVIGGNGGLRVSAVAIGDMDRDGFADVALAHYSSSSHDGRFVTIVRGGLTNPSLPYLTAGDARLATITLGADRGTARLAMSDLTNDGYAELVIGTGESSNGDLSGSTYVIRGGSTIPDFDLDELDVRWTRVDGDTGYAEAGFGLALGDVTGDGAADVVIGAPGATNWQGEGIRRMAVFPGSLSGDVAAPTVAAPKATLGGSGIVRPTAPVKLTWGGSDIGTGLARFEVHRRIDIGTWTSIGHVGTAKAITLWLRPGHDYRFRVRAIDGAGNSSPWVYGKPFRLKGFGDASGKIAYAGKWKIATSDVWWGGSARYSRAKGASATLTFTGREIVWVSGKGLNRGTAKIYINGVLERSVDFGSQVESRATIVFRKAWSTEAKRTIRIVVTGISSRPRIDIDGFVVLG